MTGPRLELLYEVDGLPRYDLPASVVEMYGSGLGFVEPLVVANFVTSLDGVVAAPPLLQSANAISAASEADRFVVSLLRALSDVVLIGSGTLRASPTSLFMPSGPYPEGTETFAEIRRTRNRPDEPVLAVLTASGQIDASHPALERGAVVLTTDTGARVLERRLPDACDIVPLGSARSVDPRRAIDELLVRGHRVILSEAGPHAFGSLLTAGVVDELFLTLSPALVGRGEGATRLGLIEGHDVLSRSISARRLLSVRRDGAHLFVRYRMRE